MSELRAATPRRKVQRANGLAEVIDGRTNVDERQNLRVSAERVLEEHSNLREDRTGCVKTTYLQQESEFGIAVWNVRRLFIAQGTDDVTQTRQRLVNVLSFFQTVTSGVSLTDSLRASQID